MPLVSLYVGDLNIQVDETELYNIFNSIGTVTSVKLCRHPNTRRSLGYAYVNFQTAEDAEKAIEEKNFFKIRGRPCRIMYTQHDPKLRKSGKGNLFIKNLPESWDTQKLHTIFLQYGKILSSKVQTKDGKSLCYGFVHFREEKDAEAAIKTENGKEYEGKKLLVTKFKRKDERPQSSVTNLYIKPLPLDPEDFSDDELVALFKEYGTITSSKVMFDEDKKKNKGFGFVAFTDEKAAKAAMEAVNGTEIGKEDSKVKLLVVPALSKAQREKQLKEMREKRGIVRNQSTGTNLYVKHLADEIDDEELLKMFGEFGQITSGKVMLDKSTGKSRGFGFVNFKEQEAATKAVTEMHKKVVGKKQLYVALAQSKQERLDRIRADLNRRMQMQMYMQGQTQQFYARGGPQQQQHQKMLYQQQLMQQRQQQFGYQQNPMMVPRMMYPQQQMGGRGGRGARDGRNRQVRGMQQMGGPQMMQMGGPQVPPQQQFMMAQYAGAQAQAQAAQAQAQAQALAAQDQEQAQAAQAQAQASQVPIENVLQGLTNDTDKKQAIGERIYPLISKLLDEQKAQEKAGKITGMLLDMSLNDLIPLCKGKEELRNQVDEALRVLQDAQSQPAAQATA